MATALASRAMRGLALAQIRHIEPAAYGAAGPLGDRVYEQLEHDFGVIAPPVVLHSPAPEAMAACWLMLRETLLVPGSVGRPAKEAVAAAVSQANACPYCVTVHGATLRGLADGRSAARIADRRIDEVPDPRLREAARWALDGAVRPVGRRPPAPFPPGQAPEYLGVALTFHYINRMVNVFLEDAPMPPGAPRRGLAMVERVLSGMIRSASRRVRGAGESLSLLPAAEVPYDLGWASGNPGLAQALARAAATLERAGERSVPGPVRELVLSELDGWDGRALGVSRSWTSRPLEAVPASARPAARLALLTAMASYQVDDSVVEECRASLPGDAALVELAAWAAMAAARHVAGWAAAA